MQMSTEQLEKASQTMMQVCEEINAMVREIGEAAMQSATAMNKGVDEMTRCSNGMMQETFARGVSAGKTIMTCKSVQDAMTMQAEFMKDCFDGWMANCGKMSELSARLCRDVMDPITQQTNANMGKMMARARMVA